MFSHTAIRRCTCCLGLSLAVVLALSLGCGKKSGLPGQIELTGSVTYQGQPVAAGMIYFEPDAVDGNGGPQGFAQVSEGHYSTQASGRGVQPGPHTVRIEEQQPQEGEKAQAMQFYEYHTKADLTDDATEQDFEIPAETVKRKRRR